MDTLERRCQCNSAVCYLCQLDRVDAEARGLSLPLRQPEAWDVIACYDDESEEVVEAGLDGPGAAQTVIALNHEGHAGVEYIARRVS